MSMPLDSFNRRINYLRISLTDHCNLRCIYCMPIRDLHFAPKDQQLTATEIETVVHAAAKIGFTKIRLTGGEPTLRTDLIDIVERIGRIDGIDEIAMTTNAILLPKFAVPLRKAGLHRLNIHVDTLHPERIKRLMRFATLDEVWNGIEAAQEAGFSPIKINAVVVRDYNDQDVVNLARLTIDRDWHVRFIELMPIGGGECARTAISQYVPNDESHARVESEIGPLTPMSNTDLADESRNFRLPNAQGIVGFISPVSAPYCDTCNRMRLTVDGKLHLCLLNDHEVDLKPALRNGSDHKLTETLIDAIRQKPTGHRLDEGISTEHRGMFQIGG
jgi:GTP 3',8-cyclase